MMSVGPVAMNYGEIEIKPQQQIFVNKLILEISSVICRPLH